MFARKASENPLPLQTGPHTSGDLLVNSGEPENKKKYLEIQPIPISFFFFFFFLRDFIFKKTLFEKLQY